MEEEKRQSSNPPGHKDEPSGYAGSAGKVVAKTNETTEDNITLGRHPAGLNTKERKYRQKYQM